jgi:large subunit ribosomal protein L10
MPTEKNIKEVEEMARRFAEASIVIATNYRGIPVQGMERLRAALRNKGIQYRIAKNTLCKIAADEAERPEIKEIVDGPVGYVLTTGDAAEAANTLMSAIRAERLEMSVVGAVLGRDILDDKRLDSLSSLPSREILLSRLLGQMNAPVTNLVTVLSGPVRALATVLQRHIDQSGETEPAAEAAS